MFLTISFAFPYHPLGALLRLPSVCVWRAQQLQCKSESAQCLEKQQRPCEGEGGALNLKKKNAEKTIRSTLQKTLGICSPVFCTFSFTPNPIL